MTDTSNDGLEDKGIHCRRVDKKLAPCEHEACPYCHGSKAQVETGEHGLFCNYDPEKDPVHFGFPNEGTRDLKG